MSSEPKQPTEQELRAAYEAEIKRLRVEHILLDNVAALANLGMRRTGLAPETESERDPEQVRLAIESIRALLPVLEQAAPSQIGAIRDAVSQLQIAYVRIGGQAPGAAAGSAGAADAAQPAASAGAAAGTGAAGQGSAREGGAGESRSGEGGAGESRSGEGGAGESRSGESGVGEGGPAEPPPPKPGEPGPAQRSGRLWVPGQ